MRADHGWDTLTTAPPAASSAKEGADSTLTTAAASSTKESAGAGQQAPVASRPATRSRAAAAVRDTVLDLASPAQLLQHELPLTPSLLVPAEPSAPLEDLSAARVRRFAAAAARNIRDGSPRRGEASAASAAWTSRAEKIVQARRWAWSSGTQNEVWLTNQILEELGEPPLRLTDDPGSGPLRFPHLGYATIVAGGLALGMACMAALAFVGAVGVCGGG